MTGEVASNVEEINDNFSHYTSEELSSLPVTENNIGAIVCNSETHKLQVLNGKLKWCDFQGLKCTDKALLDELFKSII